MMAPRLLQLRRTLKETGSIFLHCDPTASHYLKLLMDSFLAPPISGMKLFGNPLHYKESRFFATRFPSTHDILLSIVEEMTPKWNPQYLPHREEYIKSHYSNIEEGTGRRIYAR